MASDADEHSDAGSMKSVSSVSNGLSERNFKCCVKKSCKAIYFCVNCEEIYHGSCAKRKNYKFISKSRIICCATAPATDDNIPDANLNLNKEEFIRMKCKNDELSGQIVLLQKLIDEMSDKNAILKENNRLLIQRVSSLESTTATNFTHSKDNPKEKHDSSAKDKQQQNSGSYSAILQNNRSDLCIAKSDNTGQAEMEIDGVGPTPACPKSVNIANVNNERSLGLQNQPIQMGVSAEMVKSAVNNALALNRKGEDDGFTQVSYKRRMNRNQIQRGSNVDANNGFIASNSSKMWLYIGKAAQSVNTKTIEDYVTRRLSISGEDLIIEQLKTIGRTNSFKLGITPQEYERINSSQFWPHGIIFRRFNFKRHRDDSKGNGATFDQITELNSDHGGENF